MSKNHYAEITPAKGTLSAAARAGGSLLAETTRALKLTEYHFGKVFPAVYYIPRQDIDFSRLVKNRGHSTHCPIKGEASYYSLKTDEGLVENIAWSYQAPLDHVALIKGFLAFDAKAVKITRKP
ncbi:MAG: DUF427 domain-containing protein [Proteobacteria bacterium]|nr:DUF427 domain-containing protein [Pseudomonadota bacterium]